MLKKFKVVLIKIFLKNYASKARNVYPKSHKIDLRTFCDLGVKLADNP